MVLEHLLDVHLSPGVGYVLFGMILCIAKLTEILTRAEDDFVENRKEEDE
jgi:hypothetical protein